MDSSVSTCGVMPGYLAEKPHASEPNAVTAPKPMIPWGWYAKRYGRSGFSSAVRTSRIGKYSLRYRNTGNRRSHSLRRLPTIYASSTKRNQIT